MKGTKIIYLKKRMLAAVACLLTAAGMFWVVNHPAIVGAAATERQLPIYCVQKDYKVVSVSFDAAWGNEDTQQLIDILGKYNIKATFFVVGEWVDKYPESVKALHDAGHEIMNHSNSHAHFNSLSTGEIVADLNACNDKIEAVTGVRPTLFRCPYGEYDDHVILATRSIKMEPIQWDVEALAAVEIPCGRKSFSTSGHKRRAAKTGKSQGARRGNAPWLFLGEANLMENSMLTERGQACIPARRPLLAVRPLTQAKMC